MSKAIPIEWIDKHLEWLNSCDNEFAQLANVSIRSMVKLWQSEQTIKEVKENSINRGWIPCSERMPEHSYTKRFWLTVKLDDGTITTLIGTWSAWGGLKDSKSYDAFDCWKDTMINSGIYRLSQPIPKEQVLAWMPAPEPWKGEDDE